MIHVQPLEHHFWKLNSTFDTLKWTGISLWSKVFDHKEIELGGGGGWIGQMYRYWQFSCLPLFIPTCIPTSVATPNICLGATSMATCLNWLHLKHTCRHVCKKKLHTPHLWKVVSVLGEREREKKQKTAWSEWWHSQVLDPHYAKLQVALQARFFVSAQQSESRIRICNPCSETLHCEQSPALLFDAHTVDASRLLESSVNYG